ncbi:MAG TPA: YkgJ family cysteine cluster protein [Candidatus Gastranaerophilales bacterium]|nr:YkgJ family cysteine cluster protein [Candidatus Gastranaerophilales bacterium]
MEKLKLQLEKEKELYRELFINAEKGFKDLVKKLKSNFSCINCGVCCKVKYSKLSPDQIFGLANEENDKISKEYIKLFAPYGVNKGFIYSKNNEISVEINNNLAKKENNNKLSLSYIESILSKHTEPVYFYYCRNLDENNQCIAKENSFLCDNFPDSVSIILPENCAYKSWQKLIMDTIKNEIEPEIELKITEILNYRSKFSCNRTGTCCKLASSEFSYEEIKYKALNNDRFAKQFAEIFTPYQDIETARKVFPQYVDLLISRCAENEKLNFYYCKHLKDGNICAMYESRPDICRDFPDNPLSIMPPSCGYYAWKEEVIVAAYTFHAMKQIYDFYFEKIKNVFY